MKRLITSAVAVPFIVAAVLWLPQPWLMLVGIVLVEFAVFEYVELMRRAGVDRAVKLLLVLVPVAIALLCADSWGLRWSGPEAALMALFACSGAMGVAVLASRGGFRPALGAIGASCFGLAYFSTGIVGMVRLQGLAPWLLMMFLVMVWAGDTAAYVAGTRWGRRKLAPVVSPHKTWIGAVAGFGASLLVVVLWCLWRLETVDPVLVLAAAAAAVAAQLGDLLESLLKRGVGVKDSGTLLPGHGGMLDRMDAVLLAGPTFYLALRALGAAG